MTTMTFSPFRNLMLAVVASATVLGFAAVPAEAGEADGLRTASIEVPRQQLASAEGRAAVDARVLGAARTVCSVPGADRRNLRDLAAYRQCVVGAVRDAQTQMAAIADRTQLASAN